MKTTPLIYNICWNANYENCDMEETKLQLQGKLKVGGLLTCFEIWSDEKHNKNWDSKKKSTLTSKKSKRNINKDGIKTRFIAKKSEMDNLSSSLLIFWQSAWIYKLELCNFNLAV